MELGKTMHVHCSGLLGDRDLSQYVSFTQKVVWERPVVTDNGQDSALHVNHSGLLGDRALSQYDSLLEI